MNSPIFIHDLTRKAHELAAIGILLRGANCGHCSYPTALEDLKKALGLPPVHIISPKERNELFKLKQHVWLEAKNVDYYSKCGKCITDVLMDKQVLMVAIGKVLHILDYALGLPIATGLRA